MKSTPTDKPASPRKRRWRLLSFAVLAHVLGAASSVDALMSTRTSQGTIAWIISLNTFPYASVPAYWVFGRDRFQGYVIARRDDDSELAMSIAPQTRELWAHQYLPTELNHHLYGVERLA